MTVVSLLLGKGEAFYRVKSWEKIEMEYKALIGQGWNQQPMADLIQFIRMNGLSEKLYAATEEGAILIISNTKKINAQKKTLYVNYDGLEKKWVFKYYSRSTLAFVKKSQVHTNVCDSDNGIENFANFLRQMKWVKSA